MVRPWSSAPSPLRTDMHWDERHDGERRGVWFVWSAVDYAREKVYPKDCTTNEKRIIRKKAAKLLLEKCFPRMVSGSYQFSVHSIVIIMFQFVKCIPSRSDQRRIVRSCHIDPTSGHLGSTTELLNGSLGCSDEGCSESGILINIIIILMSLLGYPTIIIYCFKIIIGVYLRWMPTC